MASIISERRAGRGGRPRSGAGDGRGVVRPGKL